MDINKILEIPVELQIILFSGYLSYRVMRVGHENELKNMDSIFKIIIYGIISSFILSLFNSNFSILYKFILTTLLSLSIEIIWRKFLRRIFILFMSALDFTRENYYPTTWAHIMNVDRPWSYVSVMCNDGSSFESDLTILPLDIPMGPIDIDSSGNIGLYVTRIVRSDNKINNIGLSGVVDQLGRQTITYLPAKTIKHVSVSFSNK